MKFETLRMMAQDYADRHKEPPSLPATIDTMAYAYRGICQEKIPGLPWVIFPMPGMAMPSISDPTW